MKLSELVSHQEDWEAKRGIGQEINGRWNIDRIQAEVDELRATEDPYDAINEALDCIIILAGGIAHSTKEAGISMQQVDAMLLQILRKNENKYDVSLFDGSRTVEDALSLARATWLRRLSEGKE